MNVLRILRENWREILRRAVIDIDDDLRDYHIRKYRVQEGIADFLLRLIELVLICGAVAFVEQKAGRGHLSSVALSGLVAVYARARASSAALNLLAEHNLSPRRQAAFFWLTVVLAAAFWFGIISLTNAVVPLIANAQRVS